MTLDEAIEYYIKVATQRAIADEEMGVNDKWNETKFMTKKESEQIIADNRQLAEWLRELKKAKRLLGEALRTLNDSCCHKDCRQCKWNGNCEMSCRFAWKYGDEASALIGDELNGI